MIRYYELDKTNHIIVTADTGRITTDGITGDRFDFPDDFDFDRQHFYCIIDGELVEDAEAVAAEQAAIEAEQNRPTPEERIAELEEALELLLSGVTE